MTRGKNSNKAANRERVVADRTAHLEREIARLELRLEKSDRANLEQQAVHQKVVRDLQANLGANTSPQVRELTERNEALAGELEAAKYGLEEIQKNWNRVVKRVLAMFRQEYGSHEEAVQQFLQVVGEDPEAPLFVSDGEEVMARKHGARGVQAMRRARRGVS